MSGRSDHVASPLEDETVGDWRRSGGWYEQYLAEARAIAATLGVGSSLIPTLDRPDEGSFVRDGFELVFTERGLEQAERFDSLDDLVWAVTWDMSFALAVEYEFHHRHRGVDSRRQMFAHQLKLLARLGPEAVSRGEQRQQEILRDNPFDDQLARRADRWAELIDSGMPREEAVALATAEFPA
jgi:hypothetical protein